MLRAKGSRGLLRSKSFSKLPLAPLASLVCLHGFLPQARSFAMPLHSSVEHGGRFMGMGGVRRKRSMENERYMHACMHTGRRTDRQASRQAGRLSDGYIDRQADRQTSLHAGVYM